MPDGCFVEYISDARVGRIRTLIDGLLVRQYPLQTAAELDGAGNLINRNLFD